MELIRPGSKQKVKITRIAAENTPSRHMRRLESKLDEDVNIDKE